MAEESVDSLGALVRVASLALCGEPPDNKAIPPGVFELLSKRNGFYAFESALHVFPARSVGVEIGAIEWNVADLWRDSYEALDPDAFFFAEDVFGGQFAVTDRGVHVLDPVVGELRWLADTIEQWAALVMADFEVVTGYPIAHAWQQANRALRPRERLVPKVPFVLGGGFTVDNLFAGDTVESLRWRGDLARQIKSLPDGSRVTLRVVK